MTLWDEWTKWMRTTTEYRQRNCKRWDEYDSNVKTDFYFFRSFSVFIFLFLYLVHPLFSCFLLQSNDRNWCVFFYIKFDIWTSFLVMMKINNNNGSFGFLRIFFCFIEPHRVRISVFVALWSVRKANEFWTNDNH